MTDMTKSKKVVMQQMLDAIKNVTPTSLSTDCKYEKDAWQLRKTAIKRLEAAIARPVQPVQPVQQAVQEPAMWIDSTEWERSKKTGGSLNAWLEKYPECDTPLYVRPIAQPAESAEHTEMTNDQGRDFAWSEIKKSVGTVGWTVSDHCTFQGFFNHGWDSRSQFQKQSVQPQESVDPVEPVANAQWAHKDMSLLLSCLKDTNFDIKLITEMLEFAVNAAKHSAQPPQAITQGDHGSRAR